jgi:DDE superfamily endonuclease
VRVFEKRSGLEYAKFMQYISEQFKDAEKIVLVQDNLATHSMNSFYSHLKPDLAFKLVQKFEFHFTPVKSSWLNMRPRPSGASWGQEGGTRVECAFEAVFESADWEHG